MTKERRANLERWNELVPVHMRSDFYAVDDFRNGRSTLGPIAESEVGVVAAKKLLHLQCHFGLDTLSLARKGAIATGVDYAPDAIREARKLTSETGLSARFLCSDVYELPATHLDVYDVVFCSYGVLIWLDDLSSWARIVSEYLSPGGFLYLLDEHPLALTLKGEARTSDLRFVNSYFSESGPKRERVKGSYADREAEVVNDEIIYWIHSMSSIVNALLEAGLRLDWLHEFPYSSYEMFPGMERDEKGRWRLEGVAGFPYLFSLKATKT